VASASAATADSVIEPEKVVAPSVSGSTEPHVSAAAAAVTVDTVVASGAAPVAAPGAHIGVPVAGVAVVVAVPVTGVPVAAAGVDVPATGVPVTAAGVDVPVTEVPEAGAAAGLQATASAAAVGVAVVAIVCDTRRNTEIDVSGHSHTQWQHTVATHSGRTQG
jgi:hypothetical protein